MKARQALHVIGLALALVAAGFGQNVPAAVDANASQQPFRIMPVRPIAELRAEALKAQPPEESGPFEKSSLIELVKVGGYIKLDIRYATSDNFLGAALYKQPRAYLQFPVAMALRDASEQLAQKGYGLLVYDAYRPWYVTKLMWNATPVEKREFVADPAQGSQHNRGCAVDLTLYEIKTGNPVAMPSGFDEMSPRAYSDYSGGAAEERKHREILRKAMESHGFMQLPNEWWHFDYKDCKKFAILNASFDKQPMAPYKVGNGVLPPRMLKHVDPEYTNEAREKHVSGTVILYVEIDDKGVPGEILVLRSLGCGLDNAAVEAVKNWRFAPGTSNGKPVPVGVNVEVNFHLGFN